MRQQFHQIEGVIVVVVMDVREKVIQPFTDIDFGQFATAHEGVDDGSFFSGIMITTE